MFMRNAYARYYRSTLLRFAFALFFFIDSSAAAWKRANVRVTFLLLQTRNVCKFRNVYNSYRKI